MRGWSVTSHEARAANVVRRLGWAFAFALLALGGCTNEPTSVAQPATPTEAPLATPKLIQPTIAFATSSPTAIPVAPSGPNCKPPEGEGRGQGAVQGTGFGPFCVAWVDRFAGEAGFRITLSYSQNSESRSQSGEVFTYTTSPNEVEFIFPASDRPYLTADVATCLQRNSYQISVVAVFPGGREEPVGGFGSIVECARR